MGTATFIRSSLNAILDLMIAQIAQYVSFDASRILVVAGEPDEIEHFYAPQDVLIRPMDEDLVSNALEGAGRVDDRRARHVQLICRSRSFVDEAKSDYRKLTDATKGLFALEDKVADALQNWMATDAEGNALCMPVYLKGPTSPRKDRSDVNWISSYFTADVEYVRDLDQSWL